MEIQPGGAAESQGQVLEQALGDETQLDVPFVSGEFAAKVLPVERRLALEGLLAAATVERGHVPHPEVVGISAQGVNGLLEADFNFESPAVEANTVQRAAG